MNHLTAVSGVGSSPTQGTCETSQALLAVVSGAIGPSHILSTTRAYLCVIADKHFLIDPHSIVKASMCDLFIFFNCPVSRL